jgi:S-adenosylmethionine decarboxylase
LGTGALPFEGPEKKLEFILSAPRSDLRSNADRRWHRVSAASGADIISSISSEEMDAYLLSESSLFVWPDRVLMITCGQTALINAVPEILHLVGSDNVAMVFYERKNFLFPDRQPADFEADAAQMESYFSGKSYRLGPANQDHVHVFLAAPAPVPIGPGVTVRMLMTDLSDSAARTFQDSGASTEDIGRGSGIDRLYTGMKIDSHLFSPYGYSMNGISGGTYFTVHVTPQTVGSYTGFETNVIEADYSRLMEKVVSIFRPARFSVLLTTSSAPRLLPLHRFPGKAPSGYVVTEKSCNEFSCGYTMTFMNFIRAARESGRDICGSRAGGPVTDGRPQ